MYLGNQPALSYTSLAKQDFTTSATTSYVLDNPVANENEIALFINFVRQEPTTAYTASGTSLTLTSATSASDDMYAIFLGKAVQTVNPPAGSVGSKSYTVNVTNTWEKKTITFEGDTTGAFDNDNGFSLSLNLYLGAGSDRTSGTLQTTWGATTTANRAVGQVNVADDTSNDWYITGVQLEAGTTASDFEFLPV
jgi:hypothetical protein